MPHPPPDGETAVHICSHGICKICLSCALLGDVLLGVAPQPTVLSAQAHTAASANSTFHSCHICKLLVPLLLLSFMSRFAFRMHSTLAAVPSRTTRGCAVDLQVSHVLYRRMQLPIQQGSDADVVLPTLRAAVFVEDDGHSSLQGAAGVLDWGLECTGPHIVCICCGARGGEGARGGWRQWFLGTAQGQRCIRCIRAHTCLERSGNEAEGTQACASLCTVWMCY
jgi:hypothetical protein